MTFGTELDIRVAKRFGSLGRPGRVESALESSVVTRPEQLDLSKGRLPGPPKWYCLSHRRLDGASTPPTRKTVRLCAGRMRRTGQIRSVFEPNILIQLKLCG